MKVLTFSILILLLVYIQHTGYAQSENSMTNDSIAIPLKTGKNPSIQFEALVIEPVNLFIQSKLLNTNSPQIQLELNVFNNNTKYATFLWCYDAFSDRKKTNYPKAYQNYSFDLKIEKNNVALVVTKLEFGKPMFIDLGQTAVIGNLQILFKDYIGESSEDINGNQTDAFNSYHMLLSEDDEQKTVSFTSLNKAEDKDLIIEWKHYKIMIIEDSEKAIKLMVVKNDSNKN
ncbi:hypothetical protein [Winogradskyella thalassocola]|uniref:Uncharacterized protein n=1 Tax=Winogradskyella thalassocola TaxID=262004 RepID=A0A1G8G928_9FLAO|nr:hypothetical protein [Winogradskyella thalassocola]SDH90884.1 hypothetical protein SAMN04489796_105135 [Winogradskyella thalassocola]